MKHGISLLLSSFIKGQALKGPCHYKVDTELKPAWKRCSILTFLAVPVFRLPCRYSTFLNVPILDPPAACCILISPAHTSLQDKMNHSKGTQKLWQNKYAEPDTRNIL